MLEGLYDILWFLLYVLGGLVALGVVFLVLDLLVIVVWLSTRKVKKENGMIVLDPNSLDFRIAYTKRQVWEMAQCCNKQKFTTTGICIYCARLTSMCLVRSFYWICYIFLKLPALIITSPLLWLFANKWSKPIWKHHGPDGRFPHSGGDPEDDIEEIDFLTTKKDHKIRPLLLLSIPLIGYGWYRGISEGFKPAIIATWIILMVAVIIAVIILVAWVMNKHDEKRKADKVTVHSEESNLLKESLATRKICPLAKIDFSNYETQSHD